MSRFRNKVKAFKFKPFSKKQKQVLHFWREGSPYKDKDMLIADGSIRSGKTISMICSFLQWSQDEFEGQDFIIAGKSVGALKRNVIKPMKQILSAWGWSYEHNRSENYLLIGSNTYYLFGANNEASQDVIQGLTAAGGYGDEVALFPKSFVDQMIGRCSVDGAKLFFNCNPKSPNHYFKTEYIDKAEEKNIYYISFKMDDNLSLSKKIKERYYRMFTGVFFQRYILGMWVMAEGVIYKLFANSSEKYLIDKPSNLMMINVGVDFGGNKSKHTFVATGITHDFKSVVVLKSERHEPNTPETLNGQFVKFVKEIQKVYGGIDVVYADSAEQVLIRGMQKALLDNNINLSVKNSIKNEIIDRIRLVNSLIATGRFFYTKDCQTLVDALSTAVWDDKELVKDVRLDDGTSDIDTLDAFEYSFEKYIKALTVL